MPQDEGLDDAPIPEIRGESRRDRLVSWLHWAAAPLGFSVFLVAITLFGLLKDEPAPGAGGPPAAGRPATPPTAAPSVPTSVPDAPTTTALATEPPATEPFPTEPPPTEPPRTQAPATEPPPGPGRVSPSAGRSTSARFGPVCGHPPGQTFHIRINGQPARPVTADARGCVTVNR